MANINLFSQIVSKAPSKKHLGRQIELFFRKIKQLLQIKLFIGTAENAVMIQIWTAMISILILKFLKEMGG